jgi:hypothetical protein
MIEGGHAGKYLFVNLTDGVIHERPLPEDIGMPLP